MAVVALIAGCSPKERYLYVEDAPHDTPMPITNNYDATIYPNDLLYIYVSSQQPESVKSFNEETNRLSGARTSNRVRINSNLSSAYRTSSKQSNVDGYLVSQSGAIIFPILGRIEVAGKTRSELCRELEGKLIEGGYVTDPVVTVELMNFHVTVIGEVKYPHTILATGSRLTIFEALAQAGDITMYGLRTNVVVVRTGKDSQIVDTLDLTRKEIFNSPYYYLQQNDIIYVEPTEKRKKEAWRDEDWIHYITIGAHTVKTAYQTIYTISRMNYKTR